MTAARILVVEDEAIVALHLKQQLINLGYDVPKVVASGEQAIAQALVSRPDLILMDINIQGDIDGIEAAQRLPEDMQIPVIYLTAYADEKTLERAKSTRPYGYLAKPYSERELHATIQMGLERHRADQTLRASNHLLEQLTAGLQEEVLERRKAEEAVLATSDLLHATFDAAPFPIMVTNSDVKVLMWNRAGERTFGFANAEIVGQSCMTLLPCSQLAPFESFLKETASFGSRTDREVRFQRHDGKPLHIMVHSAPIFGTDKKVRAIVSILEDITERKFVEEQLRQAQKMEAIGNLTGGMAHDFNNILGVIIGNLDLLRDVRPDDEELKTLTSDAIDAAMRGADLTRRLLAFARRQPLQPQRIEVNEFVAGLVRLLTRVLGENIEISVDFSDEVWPVVADAAQLSAALTNLATNARDAMPNGGRLMLTTRKHDRDANALIKDRDFVPGDYTTIDVTDTGTGMPPEILEHIFEPFYSTKDKDKGTGLGLSMVFGFVKQSGGHITVHSEVGKGTTFTLYLPRARQMDLPIAVAPERREFVRGRGEAILACDDNDALRKALVRQLKELNYVVVSCASATEALAVLADAKIDVLVTDVVMPGSLNGMELAEEVLKRWPSVKVVLTSASPDRKLLDMVESHPFGFIVKPYRKDALARTIRNVLEPPLARMIPLGDSAKPLPR
jgi:two-component system cell cycle sensor histidine kinase/response regulator CckA